MSERTTEEFRGLADPSPKYRSTGIAGLWLAWTVFIILSNFMRTGLLHDSVTYLDVAQQLLAGEGLTHRWAYWDPVYKTAQLPTRTTMWPPAYSLSIAAISKLGLTPYHAARVVSGVSLSVLPLLLYALALQIAPRGRPLLSMVAALVCFPLARMSGMVAAEPPFLVMLILCIYFTIRARSSSTLKERAAWLAAASIMGGVAYLFRYLAISSALALAIITAAMCRFHRPRDWPLLLAAGGLPIGLILGGWMLRERLVGGVGGLVFEGTRKPLLQYLSEAPRNILSDWLGWKALYPGVLAAARPVQLAGLAVLLFIAALQFRRRRRNGGLNATPASASIIVTIFLICYMLTVYVGVVSKDAEIEPRYVTVLLPVILLLLCGWALNHARESSPAAAPSRMHHVAISVCLIFILAQALAIGRWFISGPMDREMFAETRTSPVIPWIRDHTAKNEVLLTSDGAELAVWVLNPILRLQHRPHTAGLTENWEQIDELAARAGARYLIHLKGYQPPQYSDGWLKLMHLLDHPDQSRSRHIATLGDHVIYSVGPSRTPLPPQPALPGP